ncbi:MAG: tetratricopeptide repeat protein [Campylobacteraceae bacterium]|jgi:tetratricopeptide (TPR) repeat protein|nr:tetratricopeptide repeat protein [Campylobacteraceae bacterium]
MYKIFYNFILSIIFTVIFILTANANNTQDDGVKFILLDKSYGTKNKEAYKFYDKGNQALDKNNLKEAQSNFLKALEIDPSFVDALDHLGITYRRANDYEKAENTYLKSIKINSENFIPYANLALIYLFQERFGESIKMYSKAIELDPQSPEAYYGIGLAYYTMEDYKTSVKYIDEAIEKYKIAKSQYIYDAYTVQGENYYMLKDKTKALEYYKKASELEAQNTYLQDMIKELEGLD